MHKQSSTKRQLSIAIIIAAIALSGCETTTNWLKGRRTAEATDTVAAGTPEANAYLTELFELTTGDPATQAEIHADAASAAKLTPGTSTQLRYALVLAAPGHAEENGLEAQRLFRQLLSQQELLTTTEIELATINMKEVEARMVLDAEARRLRAETTRAASTEEAAVTQRIATVEAENRRLRQSLADAESKLEAITSIERSIREQSGSDDPP